MKHTQKKKLRVGPCCRRRAHRRWTSGQQSASQIEVPAQTLVEFALVLPILLLLMVALLDFGVIMHAQIVVTNAAWEGARAGATIVKPEQGDEEIIGAIHQASYGLNLDNLEIDIDPEQDESPRSHPFPAPRGEPLTVIVLYDIQLAFPSINFPVSGKAVTMMEYQNP
ncbi:MAG: pilus assembly protein [Anaerolineales bacterium]|nr:pilus assembly protein [Chloroflexota bacterium]MBL6982672.1 pilus assembly protein [Anaerolineales bacterium]